MNSVYEETNCSRAIMRVGLPAMIAAVTLCAHYYVDCSRSLAALTRRWMRLLYFSW